MNTKQRFEKARVFLAIMLGLFVLTCIVYGFFADSNEQPPVPFTSTIYLDINGEREGFSDSDSIYYLEVSGPDSGFVVPLATAWECAGSY